MSVANRERKIIGQVGCPACGAAIGEACSVQGDRPMVCRDRREAWQAWREERPPDLVVAPVAGAIHIRPLTPESRRWLFETPYGVWHGEFLLVLPEQLAKFMIAAAGVGFKTGATPDGQDLP
jgi:hypothetical protein